MGLLEFFVLVIIVVLLAALTAWAISHFAPAIVVKIVWGVAVVIIVMALANAIGLFSHDPQIPRIR